jgi:hypothetical protein
MKKLISITTFLAGFLCLISCNKQNNIHTPPELKCDSSNTAYIPIDARSRFYFKEGSWWVYKNIVNDEIDTVKVIDCTMYLGKAIPEIWGDIPNKCYERSIVGFKSGIYKEYTTYVDYFYPTSIMDSNKEIYLVNDLYHNTTYKLRYDGSKLSAGQDSGQIVIIDTLEIESKKYYNVIKYSTNDLFDYANELYYAPFYGIIKMIRKDGTQWNLIKVNIIK